MRDLSVRLLPFFAPVFVLTACCGRGDKKSNSSSASPAAATPAAPAVTGAAAPAAAAGGVDLQSVPECAEFLRTVDQCKSDVIKKGMSASVDSVTRTAARGNRDVVQKLCQATLKTKALEKCR